MKAAALKFLCTLFILLSRKENLVGCNTPHYNYVSNQLLSNQISDKTNFISSYGKSNTVQESKNNSFGTFQSSWNWNSGLPNNVGWTIPSSSNPYGPVFGYIDTLRSRVDNGGQGWNSHGHQSSHDHTHSHSSGHHEGSHSSHSHAHHHGEKGWGWKSHHEHQEHHHHKKKKGKKGVLAKVIKKFKLKKKPQKLIWKEVPECDGFDNFIKDLEIISWSTGLLGFKKATIGLILHFLNQVYLTFSVIKVGLPERILTFLELTFPGTTPETLKMVTEIIGVIDYVFNLFVSYPTGNLIVVIEFIAEILTIISLALATITIFDDIVEEKVWAIFGIDLREVFEGYGCDNPFSKEKKIEQFFEKFNKW